MGVGIGDYVEASIGSIKEKYIITAVFQSMQNMGSGIRIYHNKDTRDILPAGVLGIQVKYNDNPDSSLLKERKKLLEQFYPDDNVYTAGGYITVMMGDITGQIDGVKKPYTLYCFLY